MNFKKHNLASLKQEHTLKSEPNKYKEYKWFSSLNWKWTLISSTYTLLILFLIIFIEPINSLITSEILNETLLEIFPAAQYWQNASLIYKQEIVFIYFYTQILYLIAFILFCYIYFLKRLEIKKVIQQTLSLRKKELCEKKLRFLVALILSASLVYALIFFTKGSISPEFYEYSVNKNSRWLNQYILWNTYFGLNFLVFFKVIVPVFIVINLPISFLTLIACSKQ